MRFLVLASLIAAALGSHILLPAYPLAVKTPYLSTWFPGQKIANFTTTEPMFWTQAPLAWIVLARVNGQTYSLFGCPDTTIESAKLVDIEFTSTHTLATLKAGSTQFVLDFFSPVSLTDYVRQSIPFSYLTVSVSGAPKQATIDILSAIDGSWTAQNNDAQVVYSQTAKNSHVYTLSGKNSIPFTEVADRATYGNVIFAADAKSKVQVTYQTAVNTIVKSQFEAQGILTSNNTVYQPGNLVALAYRFNSQTESSVTFAIGLEQDVTINWLGVPQTGYYRSEFNETNDAIDHFFADEKAARAESSSLDAKITSIGNTVSANYSDVLESTVRQIWGGFELTVPASNKDTTQAKAFMKEISTDGNVNTLADLIPKALPVFYLLAPDYIRLLLEPIMEYTAQWPANYAFHDLGKHYPNATGETVAGEEMLILDQTSVIHWMAYAYQKASGNTKWVKPYLPALQKYADYLVANGLYPASQKSSTDSIGATPNQTVLAIYSAIGLTSFGALSGQKNYTDKGKEFAPLILEMGTDTMNTHILAHYHDPDSSWVSTYPFAFDKMLGLNTFNSATYAQQSAWYETELHPYGMPFYSGVDYTVAEAALWCAATSSDQVRDALINGIHMMLTSNLNDVPGPTQWNVTGANEGVWFLSTTKSNVGSYFMPVAAEQNSRKW